MKIKCFLLVFGFALSLVVDSGAQTESIGRKDSLSSPPADTLQEEPQANKSLLKLVDIKKAWQIYQPATLDPVNWRPIGPHPDTLSSLIQGDVKHFNDSRLDPAIDSLLIQVEEDSLEYELYNLIGVKYGKIGYLNEAKKYLERAITINSTFFKAMNNIGNVYFKEGNFEEAYSQYGKAADYSEENPDILRNWAFAAFELGKTEEAVELEDRAIELQQNESELFRITTHIASDIAMKASEGVKTDFEPIWIE